MVEEAEPHLDNPAVRLGFSDQRTTVRWGGAELELDGGGAAVAEEEDEGRPDNRRTPAAPCAHELSASARIS